MIKKLLTITAIWLGLGISGQTADGKLANTNGDSERSLEQSLKTEALKGSSLVQERLGNYYEERKRFLEAEEWYLKAAKQGDLVAQYKLGRLYEKGMGVPKDYAEAIHWYKISAENGDWSAQLELGRMLRDGRGAQRNLVDAYAWLNLAAASRSIGFDESAAKERDLLEKQLSPDAVTKAHQRTKEFREMVEANAKRRGQ
jgi:TPR repeat protein